MKHGSLQSQSEMCKQTTEHSHISPDTAYKSQQSSIKLKTFTSKKNIKIYFVITTTMTVDCITQNKCTKSLANRRTPSKFELFCIFVLCLCSDSKCRSNSGKELSQNRPHLHFEVKHYGLTQKWIVECCMDPKL